MEVPLFWRKSISNKWVFRINGDTNGNIEKYKARIVIKCYAQRQLSEYEEPYVSGAFQ